MLHPCRKFVAAGVDLRWLKSGGAYISTVWGISWDRLQMQEFQLFDIDEGWTKRGVDNNLKGDSPWALSSNLCHFLKLITNLTLTQPAQAIHDTLGFPAALPPAIASLSSHLPCRVYGLSVNPSTISQPQPKTTKINLQRTIVTTFTTHTAQPLLQPAHQIDNFATSTSTPDYAPLQPFQKPKSVTTKMAPKKPARNSQSRPMKYINWELPRKMHENIPEVKAKLQVPTSQEYLEATTHGHSYVQSTFKQSHFANI